MIDAIVFDFDGVLADTERLHLRAFQTALGDIGWSLDERAYYSRYIGYDDRETVEQLAADRGESLDRAATAQVLARKKAAYKHERDRDAILYPGARECIERLRSRVRLAVASGSLRVEIQEILTRAGVFDAFTAIVGADEVARGKPAPDLYLEACRRIGVEPAHAMAVEDTPFGLQAARTAGLYAVGITTTTSADQLWPLADRVISSLDEVDEDWFKEWA